MNDKLKRTDNLAIVLVAIFALVMIAPIILLVVNQMYARTEPVLVGEPYKYAYNDCVSATYIKTGRICNRYETRYETRQNVIIDGFFFKTESYIILDH